MVSHVQNFFLGLLGENEVPVVEDLFRRATEAGLTFSSDKTKPGLKTVQIVVKNLSTNGDFIHMEWELYNNEGDELRALRLHRQRQAAGSGSTGAKIVLDPADHSSLLLKDPTLQIPKRATVSTIVALQDVLELRANAHDVAQQVPAPVYSEFMQSSSACIGPKSLQASGRQPSLRFAKSTVTSTKSCSGGWRWATANLQRA